MPTYRYHKDTRDGKIYNCVLMPDGKWWSVDDYRYDGSEWISPPDNHYWDAALAAARLYRRSTLIIPPGAHLPTSAEWTAMGTATGTLADSKPLRSAQGWDALRAGPDTYGFGMIGANGSPYLGPSWGSTGFTAMLLSANGIVQTSGGAPGLSIDNNPTPPDYYGSVRFIVDVFNVPSNFKLFGKSFQGFDRDATVTITRQIQVQESEGGSVTLIPTAPAQFDSWDIEVGLRVSAAQAQAIEASLPPYGTPSENALRLPPRGGGASFPGLLPLTPGETYDLYAYPMAAPLDVQGRVAIGADLFSYRMSLRFFAAHLSATNAPTATTMAAPEWLTGKAITHSVVDPSASIPTIIVRAPSVAVNSNFHPTKQGRTRKRTITLDCLSQDRADELVGFFRGVRHNPTTIMLDNGANGFEAISVYLTALSFTRGDGLYWTGSLEVVLA